jgi:hypothetical protein
MSDDAQAFVTAYLTKARAIIAEHGHLVQYVGPDGPGSPGYAYTVGLHTAHGFELAMSGLDPQTGRGLLNDLASRAHVLLPHEGLLIDQIVAGGYRLRLTRTVRPREFSVLWAIGAPPSTIVWQAQWPDNAHRFPGDPKYSVSPGTQVLL